MASSALSGSSSCRHNISMTLRIALVLCLATFAAAADAGTCSGSDREQGTCPSSKEIGEPSYDILCRASFERIDELNHLAQSDAAVFVPQAWAWIEEAGKCVYAIDNHIITEPSPSSSSTLKSHIVTFLRSVLSLDTSALTPPPGACSKMLLAKKKKSMRKFFDFTVPGGGLHPDLNIKNFMWNISTYDGVITNQVIRVRGVYSSSDISSGTAIAFIPSSHLLHLSQFNRSKIWASLKKLPAPPNTNNVRILQTSVVAAFELSNPRSWWLPLLCNLPSTYEGMALMLGQQSLEATGDSGLFRAVDTVTRDLADHMHMILPALEHRVPPKNYIWAFLAVLSRSFTVRSSSNGVAGSHPLEPGLAPFVDMVNHHENPHVIVQADVFEGVEMGLGRRPGIAMSTIRDVKAGEEIYFSYGAHCAREWVFTYGFVPSEGLLPLSQCSGM